MTWHHQSSICHNSVDVFLAAVSIPTYIFLQYSGGVTLVSAVRDEVKIGRLQVEQFPFLEKLFVCVFTPVLRSVGESGCLRLQNRLCSNPPTPTVHHIKLLCVSIFDAALTQLTGSTCYSIDSILFVAGFMPHDKYLCTQSQNLFVFQR